MNKFGISFAAFAASFGMASLAFGQAVINNGPYQTHANGGPGNAPRSVLQTASPLLLNTYGFGCQLSANNRVADDFVVPANTKMKVQAMRVYLYQTGATSASINHLNARIWNGAPNGGGSVIWGNTATNILSANTLTSVFRVDDVTTPIPSNRQVQLVQGSVSPAQTMNPGTYWLDYQAGGTLASGPWALPVTILGQGGKTGANGLQFDSLAWAGLDDAGFAQDVCFELLGSWILPPTAQTLVSGVPFGGGLPELQNSDNAHLFILLDEGTPNANIEYTTTTPSTTLSTLSLTHEDSSTRNDLIIFIDFQNNTNGWEAISNGPSTFTDTVRVQSVAVNAGRFLRAGGQLKARMRAIPTEDLVAEDGWSVLVDQVQWEATP